MFEHLRALTLPPDASVALVREVDRRTGMIMEWQEQAETSHLQKRPS
jgi:hypothetical protein